MPADTLSTHVARGPSRIAGRGLVATAPVAAGETVISYGVSPATSTDDSGFGPVNHSCEPNLAWTSEHDLAALIDIPKGMELVVDYSTAISAPDWVLFCHCETYRCRQAVEGTDWRIPQLQRRYEGRWHPAVAALVAAAPG